MTRVRSVPVAQVRELLTTAFAACEVNTGATTPAEYAASVVGQLKPVKRGPKVPDVASVWRASVAWGSIRVEEFCVDKCTPTRLRLVKYWDKWIDRDQIGSFYFLTEREALATLTGKLQRDLEAAQVQCEEAQANAYLLEQALAEL